MLTKEEAQAVLTLLNRVDLKGNEAMSVALIQQKLSQIANPQPVKTESKEDKKK